MRSWTRWLGLGLGVILIAGCGHRRSLSYIDLEIAPATPSYGDADLHHLRYVLDDEQWTFVTALPEGARANYLRQVWAEIDPTPTTLFNERQDAHYRRLAYVRANFAIEEEPGFDRRGELLFRYGVPDERRLISADIVEGRGLQPPREIWVYHWLEQAYELEDPRIQGNFQDYYDAGRWSREAGDAAIAQLAPDSELPRGGGLRGLQPLDAEEQFALDRLNRWLERGQDGLQERPRAYLHDYGGDFMEYVFGVQTFAAEGDGRTVLELNTAYWANEIGYAPAGDEVRAVLDLEFALKSRDWHPLGLQKKRTVDVRAAGKDKDGVLVIDQLAFPVPPGDYRFAVSVRDSVTRRLGIYRSETSVPAYPAGELALSDVQLALEVRSRRPDDEQFVKGDLVVVPYPLGTFPKGRDIVLYFEVYGIEPVESGAHPYEVKLTIRPRTKRGISWFGSSKGRIEPGVATVYVGNSRLPRAQEYLTLDPSTFTEDVYDLTIEVTDNSGRPAAARTVSFGVEN